MEDYVVFLIRPQNITWILVTNISADYESTKECLMLLAISYYSSLDENLIKH